MVMSVQYACACLFIDGYKTGDVESRNTMHVADCKGLFVAMYAQQHSTDWTATEILAKLRELWPHMPNSALEENPQSRFEDGCIWGMVRIGDIKTKKCSE